MNGRLISFEKQQAQLQKSTGEMIKSYAIWNW